MANAYVGTGVHLADGNVIFPGVCFTHHNLVGSFNFVAPGVAIGGRAAIGDRCKFGMNAVVRADARVADGFTCEPATVVD